MRKCCCLLEKLGKHLEFITFLFTWPTNFQPHIQTWSQAHSQNWPMLMMVICSEGSGWKSLTAAGNFEKELAWSELARGGMKWGWVHPFLSPPPLSSIRFFPLSLHPIFRKRAWSQVMSLSCGIWLVGEVLWGIPWCTSKLQSTVPKPINFQPLWYNVGGLFWSHIGLKSSMLCALLFGMVHGFEKKLIFFS